MAVDAAERDAQHPSAVRAVSAVTAADWPAGVPKVWLVGAGPGDPELLTLKALRLLQRAEVVAYDELCSDAILELCPPGAELLRIGRRAADARYYAGPLHPEVVARAHAGLRVVRLKGGDPSIFGRLGEETAALAACGIDFEIVPGISAALAAAAATAIPLTHRGDARQLTVATAHTRDGDLADVSALPRHGTLVLYMGLGRLAEVTAALVGHGWGAATPAAVVSQASLPGERAVVATLADLAEVVARAELVTPAVVIVGEVVGLATNRPGIAWLGAVPARAAASGAPTTK